jgi:transcriptional regulator with XRE-family HTH domain
MDDASRRYLKVVETLGTSLNRRYGWQAEVARRLGVDRSLVSRLVNGERTSVGVEAQQRAVERLRLPGDYFTAVVEPDPMQLIGVILGRMAGDSADEGALFQSWDHAGRQAQELFAALGDGTLTEEQAIAMYGLAQQVLRSPLPAAARKLKELLAKPQPSYGEVVAAFGTLAGLIMQARLAEGRRT